MSACIRICKVVDVKSDGPFLFVWYAAQLLTLVRYS